MQHKRELIYLSALLHDIGKFYQRADKDGSNKSSILSKKVKNLENVICPSYKNRTSHKHVLWTAQFIEDIATQLNQYLGAEEDFKPDLLLRTAAAHHRPETFLEKIIQKADHYSSGVDRSKNEEAWKDAVEEEDRKWDSFKRICMRPIFEAISLTESHDSNIKYNHRLPVKEASLENHFPIKSGDNLGTPDYKSLWNKFTSEVKFIQSRSFKTFSETLLFLLDKYTSRIPSSTIHLPDVSLYDHAKTTAAFATCLYDYIIDRGEENTKTLVGEQENPFLLIGGDLSGIQNFIYDITARGAAKNLKGRSFYLQLLVDNIVRYILDQLDLFDANIVYSSGGGFYLLAPNTEETKEKLKTIEEIIGNKLFSKHGTKLFLAIDYIPFGEQELFYKKGQRSISHIWEGLSEKIATKKGQRFKGTIENNYESFFKPQKVNTESKKDYITGEELEEDRKYLDDEKNQPINYSTWQQIKLGQQLRNTDYWILSKEKLSYFDEEGYNPINIGYYNYFLNAEKVKNAENKLKQSADKVRVLYFNKDNFLDTLHKGIDNIYGYAWYGGNRFPENKYSEPKTFTELCGVNFDRPNYKKGQNRVSCPELVRLGILRMDVDNLGAIFRRGLPEGKRTFSRYCTLSRSLDYFFKGYLNKIWSDNQNYRAYSQIIYSGGDDIFIVGKWDTLIEMAKDIRNEFKKWTCYNPDLSISGGLAIVGSKFPILKGAAYSEDYESQAKKHIWNEKEKDAFSFFSYRSARPGKETEDILFSFNWEKEFETLRQLKEEIRGLDIPSGFASKVYNLMGQADFEFNHEKGRYEPKNYRVIWLIAYQFKRSIKASKDRETKDFLSLWAKNIMTGHLENKKKLAEEAMNYHSLQILAIAARWAAFEKRSII